MRINGSISNKEKINILNDFYITKRSMYVVQYPDGTFGRWTNTLGDGFIEEHHLTGNLSLNVFSGDNVSKFLTFDVDIKDDLLKAKTIAKRILDTLKELYSLKDNQLSVMSTTNKGYHVSLYFDGVVSNDLIRKMYLTVINYIGVSKSEVEMRPLPNIPVRVPFGIHQKTKEFTYFVDTENISQRISDSYVLNIQKVNKSLIIPVINDNYSTICDSGITGFSYDGLERVKIKKGKAEGESNLEQAKQVVALGHLLKRGTRYDMTGKMISYFTSLGLDEESTKESIIAILDKSYKLGLIEAHRSEAIMDLERMYNYYSNFERLNITSDVKIYEQEIKTIFKTCKAYNLKQLAYALLLISKAYQRDTFYVTYAELTKYGVTKNRKRALDMLKTLEELGLISIVSRDNAYSHINKTKQANTYKVLFNVDFLDSEKDENYTDLDLDLENHTDELYEMVSVFLDDKYLLDLVKKGLMTNHEYRTHFSSRVLAEAQDKYFKKHVKRVLEIKKSEKSKRDAHNERLKEFRKQVTQRMQNAHKEYRIEYVKQSQYMVTTTDDVKVIEVYVVKDLEQVKNEIIEAVLNDELVPYILNNNITLDYVYSVIPKPPKVLTVEDFKDYTTITNADIKRLNLDNKNDYINKLLNLRTS